MNNQEPHDEPSFLVELLVSVGAAVVTNLVIFLIIWLKQH